MQLGQVLRSKIRNIPPLISVGLVLAACGTTPAAAPSVSANGSAGLKAAPAGAGASAPPAASRPPAAKLSPPSDWQAQWDRTLAAAKQEGSVSIISAPGDVYRQVFDVFQQKYGISVEVQVGNGQADLVPRIDNERKAGQYRWDVVVHSARSMFQGYKPLGALDSLRSALILPEVLDDSKWLDGFAGGWADLDSSLVYSFVRGAEPSARINRAVIPESQLSTVDQLWDPRWKGKMAWLDPRVPTGGQAVAVTIFATKGPDKLRTILRDQDPVLTQDRRQLGEWVVRGQYPIGFGVDVAVLTAFGQQGLDVKSIRPLEDSDPAATHLTSSTGAIGLFNRAPHPNAAKVLINWLLSQEGQAVYSQRTGYNVRRLDVPAADADTSLKPGRQYVDLNIESSLPYYTQAGEIIKQELH